MPEINERLIPVGTTPVMGPKETDACPVRTWSGGENLSGEPRVIGYFREIKISGHTKSFATYHATGFTYCYDQRQPLLSSPWLHRTNGRDVDLGYHESAQEAVAAISLHDWEERGCPDGE